MSQTISAVYENGTLILDEPLAVSNGVKVEIIIVPPKNNLSEKTSAENVDESTEWKDEDLRDFSVDTFRRFEQLENEANR